MTILVIRVDQQTGGPQLVFRGLTVEATATSWNETTGAEQLVDRGHPIFERVKQAALRRGPSTDDAATVGKELWNVIFEGSAALGDWWREQAHGAGASMRTILDISVPDLRSVPWELLAPPHAAPVFRSSETPWVRAVKTPWDFPETRQVPNQILVIVGVEDSEELDVDPELAAIYGAINNSPGQWNVEILDRPPEPRVIQNRYREVEPDVVHFIGHGAEVDGKLGLRMEGPEATWLLTAEDIDEWPLPPPRLVVLNACRSASPGERDAAWSCVDAFVRRGAAAVIAMQGDIDSMSAVGFSKVLYESLAKGTALDLAAAEARYAIASSLRTRGLDELAWAFPALSVTADPELVLPLSPRGAGDDPLSVPPYLAAAAQVAHCVDRGVERRTFWRAIDPAFNARAGSLFLVTGDKEIGKSSLVVSSLLTLRLRDRNVVYVDMENRADHTRRASWLEVLRGVRNALWDDKWIAHAPAEHRDRFNHELSFLMQQKDPPPWTEGSPHNDPGGEYVSVGENFDEWIDSIFESFFTMLDGAAGGEPLLVVLDSLREIEESDVRDYLAPRLIEPAADDRKWPYLRFVVVGRPDELKLLGQRATGLAGQPLRIEPFKYKEVQRLARENFARAGQQLSMDQQTKEMLRRLPEVITPDQFNTTVGFIRLLRPKDDS